MSEFQEGQTATHKDGRKIVYRGGQWVNAGGVSRTKPTPQDMSELRSASSRAQAERDAQMEYASTREAVRTMDTGPNRARMLDIAMPDEGGGILDTIGAYTLGLPEKLFGDPKVRRARDHLNTVSAQNAIRSSQSLKGTSSDRDMAMLRTAGVSPYKDTSENLRILDTAKRTSEIEQARNLVKSQWISRYGSMANMSPNGMTYEQALNHAEQDLLQNHYGAPKQRPRSAPPSKRRGRQAVREIDLNGNPIR